MVPVLVKVPKLSMPSPAVFDTVMVPELVNVLDDKEIPTPVPPELDIVMVPELVNVRLFSIPALPPVFETVIVPELAKFPEFIIPVPVPPFDIVIVPPELLLKIPVTELSIPSVADDIIIVPELSIVAELMILEDTVTVIPAGIILVSAVTGATPPIQVEPVFQLPPAGAAVIVAAYASLIENIDNVKIKTANTEK